VLTPRSIEQSRPPLIRSLGAAPLPALLGRSHPRREASPREWSTRGFEDTLLCPGFGGVRVLDWPLLLMIFLESVLVMNLAAKETSRERLNFTSGWGGPSQTTFVVLPEPIGLDLDRRSHPER
jgi:hypothetical protein